jgi:hypothetical protein
MLLAGFQQPFIIFKNIRIKHSLPLMFLSFSLLPSNSHAVKKEDRVSWPVEAVNYLNQLPNQELSLEFVVTKAMADSDVFQMHKAEYIRGQANYLSTISAEDFKIQSSVSYVDNQNQPVVPQFMSTSTKGWNAQVGFE